MKISAYSERGTEKIECEDKILVGDTILSEGIFYTEKLQFPITIAIADGVGGENAGEVASFLAVDGVRVFNRNSLLEAEDIREQIENINEQMIAYSEESLEYENMATTLTGIYFPEEGLEKNISFHIGNTRIYVFSGEYLRQITQDHTVVEECLESGIEEIAEEDLHRITGCLGAGNADLLKQLEVEADAIYWSANNLILMTSDGIHDFVGNDEIKKLLEAYLWECKTRDLRMKEFIDFIKSGGSADLILNELYHYQWVEEWKQNFMMELAQLARDKGSEDDISIVLLEN